MMAVCEGALRGTRDRALIAVGFGSGGRSPVTVIIGLGLVFDPVSRHAST
jgi:hypothetical protein